MPSEDGWRIWLADQVGSIRGAIGELKSQTAGNRQTLLESHRQLTHRMDRIEDRIAKNGHGAQQSRLGYLKLLPWGFIFKIVLLSAAATLIVTGHLTVAEIKAYMRLLD